MYTSKARSNGVVELKERFVLKCIDPILLRLIEAEGDAEGDASSKVKVVEDTEVVVVVVSQVGAKGKSTSTGRLSYAAFMGLKEPLTQMFLEPKDALHLALASKKDLYVPIASSPLWFARCGFRLKSSYSSLPKGFSPMKFYSAMVSKRSASWTKRSLMTFGVVDESRLKGVMLTDLIVPSSVSDDTSEYWIDLLVGLLDNPNAPTQIHADEMDEVLDALSARKLLTVTDYARRVTDAASKVFVGIADETEEEVAATKVEGGRDGGGVVNKTTIKTKTKRKTKKPNRRLCAKLFVSLAERHVKESAKNAKKKSGGGTKTAAAAAVASESAPRSFDASGAERLLPDIRSIVMFLRMWNGVAIDELDEGAKNKDQIKLKRGIPRATKRLLVRAMSRMKWPQLYFAFNGDAKGIVKALFRTIHVASLAMETSKRARKIDRRSARTIEFGTKRVFLLQAMLRETKYPSSEKEMESTHWRGWIQEPLKRLLRDSLFEWPKKRADPAKWIQSTKWEASLAGTKLPRPYMNTPDRVIARCGNSRRSWLTLLESNQLSAKQCLMNLRSMMLGAIPASVVKAAIERSSKRTLFEPLDLLKALGVLPTDAVEITEIVGKVKAAVAERDALREKHRKNRARRAAARKMLTGGMSGSSESTDTVASNGDEDGPDVDEVSIVFGKSFVKDKKGTVTAVERKRTVSTSFDHAIVRSYAQLLSEILEATIDAKVEAAMDVNDATVAAAAGGGEKEAACQARQSTLQRIRERSVSLISYSSHLARNHLRSGAAPLVPRFCVDEDEVMWTGESRSLYVPGVASRSRRVLCGISWCEHPPTHPKRTTIDLDLSLLLFDDKWNFIDHCSYQKMQTHGCQHSGDLTSAPHPNGARETVQIDLDALLKGFPTCQYVAIVVYSYSGQALDDLPDASVFVADPTQAGSGPGGCKIIAANRMTGGGTAKLAGYLSLDRIRLDPTVIEKHAAASAAVAGRSTYSDVLGSIVRVEKEPPQRDVHLVYVNCNQSINTNSRNATGSARLIKETLERMVEAENANPRTKLSTIAAMNAAYVSNVVVVSAAAKRAGDGATGDSTNAGGGTAAAARALVSIFGGDRFAENSAPWGTLSDAELTVLRRDAKESFLEFFRRIESFLKDAGPCERPVYSLPSTVDDGLTERSLLAVFGSVRRDDPMAIARASASQFLSSEGDEESFNRALVFTDLGGRRRKGNGETIAIAGGKSSILCFGEMADPGKLVLAFEGTLKRVRDGEDASAVSKEE
eukprot:g4393.t1